jgi:NAD(P)-dependent dehydrogenase (short-subunit alcohol dehydrogenase family)
VEIFMGTKLQGKAALVIGGSSGVGRASAEACAAEGAKVMIADVNTAGAEEAIATIKAAGGTASFILSDRPRIRFARHSDQQCRRLQSA